MCARYSLTKRRLSGIAEELDAEASSEDEAHYQPRYNVAPTQQAWIVVGDFDHRVLNRATWNYLVPGSRVLINVRGEQVASGRGFREAFAARRCVVVTDGFYEWPGKGLAPFWFHRADGGLVLLEGLFQRQDADSSARFTVLTTSSNPVVAPIHDRTPVVLQPAQLGRWFGDSTAAAELIGPAASDLLVARPVSKHVNYVRHDDPRCLAEVAHISPPRQASLF